MAIAALQMRAREIRSEKRSLRRRQATSRWRCSSPRITDFVCVNVREYDFTISRRDLRPRFAGIPSLKTEGAGNAGCLLHPRSRVQILQRERTRAYRYSRSTPAFPAQWFYGLCRALPGENSSCHHRCRIEGKFAPVGPNSPPAAWHQPRVSGPHGFAVRFSAVRLACRVRSQITRLAGLRISNVMGYLPYTEHRIR